MMKKITTLIFALALFLGMLTLSLKEIRNWQLSQTSNGNQSKQELDSYIPRQGTDSEVPNVIKLESSRETAITRGIADVAPAVVGISVTQIRYTQSSAMSDPFWRLMLPPRWSQKEVSSIGSGFIYDRKGYIITNAHVVENAKDITVTLENGTQHLANLIGIDEKTDLALIKINDPGQYHAAQIGNSDEIIMGEWVIAIGNPFGLFSKSRMPIVTAGIISSLHMDFGFQQPGRVYQDMIQTDASINVGNSGGPLVNSTGQVIGINTFIFSDNNKSGSIGIGFALPINRAMEIIDELRSKGFVDRNYATGIGYHNNDARIAQSLGLPITTGVLVVSIIEGSPAERAGIALGDIIIGIEGKGINTTDDIFTYFFSHNLKIGDQLLLNILHQGDRKDMPITLGETKAREVY